MNLKTKIISIPLGSRHVKLKVVSNLDELLVDVADADAIPFWAELWPASLALARWLTRTRNLQGLKVLELGAGLGLAGIAAALQGARVTQTDYVDKAMEMAGENARLNGLEEVIQIVDDWREFQMEEEFEIILGSDILYEPNLHPYLTEIFNRNLRPGGQIILADPGRLYGRQLIGELTNLGWRLETGEEKVVYDNKNYLIDIYTLTRGEKNEI
ncbi:MAG: methyltransferase domain-containing protein [Clostridia bacterium]|nr:methyltransferase domain-containing protein [Clostridia bacterium]